ncbi:Os04g0325300, partial [Oryza sativa Japonica Group]
DVRHLYIKACNGATVAGNKAFEKMITENIVKLKELRTLIIDGGETGIEAKVFDDIFDSLKSLRVLIVETQSRRILQIPESIGYLKYLRYLSIEYRCRIFFPRTVTKLYHLRVLDFGEYGMLERSCSPENMSNLVNLQRVVGRSLGDFPNIGRLTLLRTLPTFRVKRDLLGYDIKQLKHLNKLQGKLVISGLQHVRSEEEAVEAKLAEKEHLKQLTLAWDDDNTSSNHDPAVLECLCPPMGLQVLEIIGYRGSYPGWMVGKHSGQLYLQKLELRQCSPLGPAPRLFECFVHLESLCLSHLSWHTLPDNMEQVRTLKVLMISHCKNMKVLPTLPQSLSRFKLSNCGHEFTRSCKQNGENWEKIQHILEKIIL